VPAKICLTQIYLDIATASTIPQKFLFEGGPRRVSETRGKPFAQIRPKKTTDRDISVISRRLFLL
jgi:hypothetical protein